MADEEDEGIIGGGLQLPGGRAVQDTAGEQASSTNAAATDTKPKKMLVEEVSSCENVEETPDHELIAEDAALRLLVRVPRVGAVADLDVSIGEDAFSLMAEGLYALKLTLPQRVRADDARCKWDKRKRTLTVTMPI